MTIARRALIMVWDGMRPDLVSPELTPNLARLASRGVRFSDSHAVFPSITRVNAASLATGLGPADHGVVGNVLVVPAIDPRAAVSIGDHRHLEALFERGDGGLPQPPTLADRVAAAGGRTVVVGTCSAGAALLCHPRARRHSNDRLFNPRLMIPEGAGLELEGRFGAVPETRTPNADQDRFFARVLAEYVLPELDPRLAIYWHDDPDHTQHLLGFGSPEALAAIRNADAHLELVLAALDRTGAADDTVVAVVSDHGYISTEASAEPSAALEAAGLADEIRAGRVVLAINGAVLFAYAPGSDAALIGRLAAAFQSWEHAGVIFSGARGVSPPEGTLPLSLAGLDGTLAPDVLVTPTWAGDLNRHGQPGRSPGFDPQYLANHAGISPWEMRNTFVLAGPGLKVGLDDPLPAGVLDVAPTILHLLGLNPLPDQDGRVLSEALVDGPDPAELPVTHETVTAGRGAYRQGVRFSVAGGARCLDYGWAERA